MSNRETFLDIVWSQFKRNRPAYVALWCLLPLFAIAIFAPAIASNDPFIFYDGDETIYPWFTALFHPQEYVDYFFNMALLAALPTAVVSLCGVVILRRRGVSGRVQLGAALLCYFVLAMLISAVFWNKAPWGLRPNNRYTTRTFCAEQFRSNGTKYGVYPPIPFGPTEIDIEVRNKPPMFRKPIERWQESNDGVVHLLGTDKTGRDVLVEMIYGTRISMTVGFLAIGISIAIGILLGALSGYFGGLTDMLISRIIEVVMLFPTLFLILTLVGLLGPSIYIIMLVLGLTGWPGIARLIRGEVLKQRAIEYTLAAQALGSSNMRIVFRHILPNALSPALVAAPFGIAGAIVTEATLSLLGFGVRPPTPSWGSLLAQARDNYHYWWLIVAPSVAIFFAVTVFNLVGSGLRDAMDPKLRM